MLNSKQFSKAVFLVSSNFSIDPDPSYVEFMYDYLKDKITDAELERSLNLIMMKEDLYKMPSVKLWLKGCKNFTGEEELTKTKQGFLQKVSDYLTEPFVSSVEKEKFQEKLTYLEKTALKSLGGISSLWSRVYNNRDSLGFIIKDLDNFFTDNYKLEAKESLIEHKDEKMKRRVQELSGGMFDQKK